MTWQNPEDRMKWQKNENKMKWQSTDNRINLQNTESTKLKYTMKVDDLKDKTSYYQLRRKSQV